MGSLDSTAARASAAAAGDGAMLHSMKRDLTCAFKNGTIFSMEFYNDRNMGYSIICSHLLGLDSVVFRYLSHQLPQAESPTSCVPGRARW